VGKLREGDPADFIIVDSMIDFVVKQTYINGTLVAENDQSKLVPVESKIINNFNASPKKASEFSFQGGRQIPVIICEDKQLITDLITFNLPETQNFESSTKEDILKLTVVNRYQDKPPSVSFIKNFGIKKGAIASSVAHDSHNIIAVGTSDEMLAKAVNLIIENKGGICAVSENEDTILPLPIAGLMAAEDGYTVAKKYAALEEKAKTLGSKLSSPFMTLSFMALLVIPKLKLSDRGLFDGKKFEFVDLAKK